MLFKGIYTRIEKLLQQRRFQHIIQNSKYRQQLSELPSSLLPHWQKTAKHEFTGIPSDAVFFIQAAEGLMMFFDCVRHADKECGLPSKAADSVWHAWLSLPNYHFTAQTLEDFCSQHFGQHIPHVQASEMESDMNVSLSVTLLCLRQIAGEDPLSATVPELFTLDRRLKMPRGYSYQMQREGLGFQNMSLLGQGVGSTYYPANFEPAQLLALGLISAPMLERYQQRQAQQLASQQGSSCGSWGGVSTSTCDANADGSCDSGSSGASCGSSCGGGGD